MQYEFRITATNIDTTTAIMSLDVAGESTTVGYSTSLHVFYFNGTVKHNADSITFKFSAQNFGSTASFSGPASPSHASTFLPKVSLDGGGTAIEDGTGDGYFAAKRTGNAIELENALTVKIRPAGGSAKVGKDYEPVTSIQIPVSLETQSRVIVAKNDDEAEGLLQLYASISASESYILSAPNAVSPTTSSTTAEASKDDDVSVKSIVVRRVVNGNPDPPAHMGAHEYTFEDEVDVTGAHRQRCVRIWP